MRPPPSGLPALRRSLPPSSSWPLYAFFPSRPPSPKAPAMLRGSEIRLPLDHGPDALKSALLRKLRVTAKELTNFTVFKRGVDARKKSAIMYSYIVDAEVADEAGVLRRVKNEPHVMRTPSLE